MKSFILVPCTCKASTVLRAFTHTISFVPHNSHCRKADHVTVLWMKNPAVTKPKLEVSCHGHICESCRELSKCSHSQASLTALLITLGLRSRNLYIKTFLRWFWRSQSMTRSLRSSAHMNKSRGAQILWQVSFYYPNFKPFWSIWTLITMIALWIKPYHYTPLHEYDSAFSGLHWQEQGSVLFPPLHLQFLAEWLANDICARTIWTNESYSNQRKIKS